MLVFVYHIIYFYYKSFLQIVVVSTGCPFYFILFFFVCVYVFFLFMPHEQFFFPFYFKRITQLLSTLLSSIGNSITHGFGIFKISEILVICHFGPLNFYFFWGHFSPECLCLLSMLAFHQSLLTTKKYFLILEDNKISFYL